MSFISKITTTLAVAAFAAVATPASAAVIYSVSGDSTGGPTYNRAEPGVPPTALSTIGTAVSYNTFLFSPVASGSYDFRLTGAYDTFLTLYASPFSPTAPLTNIIAANDDLGTSTNSGFTANLLAGTVYTAVISGYSNQSFGTYQLTIANAAAVPEPATWGMMLAGFGMVGFGLRRRAKPSVRVTYA